MGTADFEGCLALDSLEYNGATAMKFAAVCLADGTPHTKISATLAVLGLAHQEDMGLAITVWLDSFQLVALHVVEAFKARTFSAEYVHTRLYIYLLCAWYD